MAEEPLRLFRPFFGLLCFGLMSFQPFVVNPTISTSIGFGIIQTAEFTENLEKF
jgi:hypothetical protein